MCWNDKQCGRGRNNEEALRGPYLPSTGASSPRDCRWWWWGGRVEQRTAGGLQPFVTSFCSRLGFYFMNLLPPSHWVESSSPWLHLVPLLRLCAWQESFRKREGPRRRLTHPARRPTHTVREVSAAASPVPFPGTT